MTEGKQSLEAYLKENFFDMIKVTSDETKVEILKSLDFNHVEIRDLKEKIVAQDRTITDLQQQMTDVLHTANKQARWITELEASNVHMETYMRRRNLIFEGCKEQDQENIYAVIVNITNVLKLQMDPGLEIDKVHRYGRSFAGKPRPVIVKFLKHTTRDKVLLAARKLKHYDTNLYINEDLPSSVKNRRAELRSIVTMLAPQELMLCRKGTTSLLQANNMTITHCVLQSDVPQKADSFSLKRHFSNNNRNLFKRMIANINWSDIYDCVDTQSAYHYLHATIRSNFDKCFPKETDKDTYRDRLPWLTNELKQQINK